MRVGSSCSESLVLAIWPSTYSPLFSGRSVVGREQFEKIVGDPFKDQAEMMETSPLYQYRELRVPVMLAHCAEDERVDFEHIRRLQRVLAMDGRPPVGYVFENAGHGFGDKDLHTLWNGIAGFLQQKLDHVNPNDASR